MPLDIFLSVLTVVGAGWFRLSRFIGLYRLPVTRKVLYKFGVFPLTDNYYEPLFRFDKLLLDGKPRELAIDWNDTEQKELFYRFNFRQELSAIPENESEGLNYYYNNGSYSGIDAEFLYCLIRTIKPKRIIEIGSGFSTRMMQLAIRKNQMEAASSDTHVSCIEPYEMPWLEQTGVEVVRKKVEEVPLSFFSSLVANDILFIDSSHIIRPQGDVLYEFFRILPMLKPGVLIHIHDIFSPFEYPESWFKKEYRMWNEQYLLEAFLMYNKQFKIIGALSYFGNKFPELIGERFPYSYKKGWQRGSAIWIRKSE